jgi:PAS domain S-box-containing protein
MVAVCGYLLLRDWFNIAAHHVYAVGLAVLFAIFTIINRQLAKSAREMRAAVVRADESLTAVRAAEAKYRSIFENAGEGIFQIASDGRYLAANPALARIFGYTSPADLIGAAKSTDAVLYVDPSRRENLLRMMQRQGRVTGLESQIRRRDGSLAWISESIHAVRDEQGLVSYYEGTVAEITDRKRNDTERDLRHQRELRHQRCLLELSQFDKSDFGAALAVLVQTTSSTLGVARTSVWRLVEKDTEQEAIVLLDLFELANKKHITDELVLKAASFPRYFAALRRETYIVAHDATTDPRTREFTESYLQPLGITAMLDVPVFIKGRLAGVLCLEHTGGPRVWQDDELAFAAAVGNMIAVTFEAAERRRAEAEAERERERAEELLLNILPKTIAQRLRHGEGLIADHYAEATVLFADIVDFTRLSANITPQAVVSYLNVIFSEFDQLAQSHGLEKIKTIGDAYMAAAGLPLPRPDHAEVIADFALAMLVALEHVNATAEVPFQMRIGIHTGPVVAGVIGSHRFLYDIWGDTVNLASRLESHSLPGRIHVSPQTSQMLADHYDLEARGLINLRGIGKLRTSFLTGRKGGAREELLGREQRVGQG